MLLLDRVDHKIFRPAQLFWARGTLGIRFTPNILFSYTYFLRVNWAIGIHIRDLQIQIVMGRAWIFRASGGLGLFQSIKCTYIRCPNGILTYKIQQTPVQKWMENDLGNTFKLFRNSFDMYLLRGLSLNSSLPNTKMAQKFFYKQNTKVLKTCVLRFSSVSDCS